jgi:hypothetical protein
MGATAPIPPLEARVRLCVVLESLESFMVTSHALVTAEAANTLKRFSKLPFCRSPLSAIRKCRVVDVDRAPARLRVEDNSERTEVFNFQ